MSNYITIKTKLVNFDRNNTKISPQLVSDLKDFLCTECRTSHPSISDGLFDPHRPGELATFYNARDKLIGFIRIIREPLQVKNKEYTLSTATLHLTANYSLEQEAARFFFMQSMKYKLSHPHEDLIHVALLNRPEDYHFISQLCTQIYPKEKTNIPEPVLKLVKHLKTEKKWTSSANHPMVIQMKDKAHNKAMDEGSFFESINPDYHQGDSLITYIPLSIANLCHGIKQLVNHNALFDEPGRSILA